MIKNQRKLFRNMFAGIDKFARNVRKRANIRYKREKLVMKSFLSYADDIYAKRVGLTGAQVSNVDWCGVVWCLPGGWMRKSVDY